MNRLYDYEADRSAGFSRPNGVGLAKNAGLSLRQVGSKLFPDLAVKFLEFLRLVRSAYQGGIGSMNDNEVLATDGGDEMLRVAGGHQRA